MCSEGKALMAMTVTRNTSDLLGGHYSCQLKVVTSFCQAGSVPQLAGIEVLGPGIGSPAGGRHLGSDCNSNAVK